MWDALLDALFDTLNIIPILFLVYLIIEFIAHSDNFHSSVIKAKKFGPLIGGTLGIFPQCGFSSAMADLYSKRSITIGTLFAVFIATSDEAIVIMLAYPNFILNLLLLIAVKFVAAVIIGYLIDIITKSYKKINRDINQSYYVENHCECNILKETIIQTLQISLFVFVATFLINVLLLLVPIESFTLSSNKFVQALITPLIGLIPNCASSIFLVELYINNLLYFGSLIGGLSAGSGVGLLVLFRKNKNFKENLLILFTLYSIGAVLGLFINIFC